MDADLKARWVAALRSGEYKQGRDVLKTKDDKFCCLGVLCDLIDKDGWENKIRGIKWSDSKIEGFPYNGQVEMITIEMQSKIGLYNPQRFSDLNDTGKSFNEIADVIETEGVWASSKMEEWDVI